MTHKKTNTPESKQQINENITLIYKETGLRFGTDAYLLSAMIRGNGSGIAVDLGSGTGVIPLLCAARKRFASIYAVEVQKDYVSIIERNVSINHFQNVIFPIHADIRRLRQNDLEKPADVVFSNPPYMKAGGGVPSANPENRMARQEICGTIEDFCLAASRLLKYGGIFYVVYRPERLADLFSAMQAAGLEPKRLTFVHPTAEHPPCLVLAEGKKGGNVGLTVTKPLLLQFTDENGNLTDTEDCRRLYAAGDMTDIFKKQ